MHSLRHRMSSIMRRRSGEIFSGESFMVLLRLRYEAECLTSQLTKQNLRDQLSTTADRSHPYRASGLVHRPNPDIYERQLNSGSITRAAALRPLQCDSSIAD